MSVQSLFQGLILRKLWPESTKTAYCKEDLFFLYECSLLVQRHSISWETLNWDIWVVQVCPALTMEPSRYDWILTSTSTESCASWSVNTNITHFSLLLNIYTHVFTDICLRIRKKRMCIPKRKKKTTKLDFLDVPSEERGRLEDCCKTASWKGCSNKPQTDPFFCILKDNKRKLYQTLH